MARTSRALGRWELLRWLNDFLCLDQSKVEELSDGVAYCQLVDAVHPEKVPLNKLMWEPRTQHERLKNLGVLEKAMRESGMNKTISADKIASGSFPENLALLQFLHAYVQRNAPGIFV
jgi:RP/EB family microtubule-associated protein